MKKAFIYISLLLVFMFYFPLLGSCEEFEIKHADSLEAESEEINVQGNILIKYKDALIEAPDGKINTNKNGKASSALFYNRARLKLKDRKIEADKITVSVQEETIIAEGNVTSELKDKENNLITISSDYQELHWNGENAISRGNVKTFYKDAKITSDEGKIIYKNKRPYQAVFNGRENLASLEQQNHETFAKEFYFDIASGNTSAFNEVKSTIWSYKSVERDKQNPILLTTDELHIEQKSGKITAKGISNKVKISYEDTKGESNEALLLKDERNQKPEKIIFTGSANVTQPDKELSSEEVVFNFNDKKLTSNTITNIRPKTLIFKKG